MVVKNASGPVIRSADYTYDALDRRLSKVIDQDGAGPNAPWRSRFVYDGAHIALAFNGSGTQTNRYLYGSGIDQVLADERSPSSTVWTLTDHQGSVRDLLDNAGTPRNRITYDSFGNVVRQTDATVSTRFGYTGREFDAETGLHYYRARYYDARVGRFLSEDPIGFNAGDTNLFRYVGNSPTNFTDPTGLIAWGPILGGLGAGLLMDLFFPDPVQAPTACGDIVSSPNWGYRLIGEMGLGFGAGALPGLARGLGGPLLRQWPQALDDLAEGAGGLGDDLGKGFGGAGSGPAPALPRGGSSPGSAPDSFSPASPGGGFPDIASDGFDSARPGMVPRNTGGGGELRAGPGDGYAGGILEGGTGRAYAGHGQYRYGTYPRDTIVPDGTSLSIWSEPNVRIPDRIGQLIEQGGYDELAQIFRDNPEIAQRLTGARTYLPGAEVPNYHLSAPNRLTIYSNSRTVEDATPLSELLQPNMGHLDWAACTECFR